MLVAESKKKVALSIRVTMVGPTRLALSASIPNEALCAGLAIFNIEECGRLVCELVHTDAAHRRKGIASAFFDHAERHFQRSAVAGLKLTPDCAAFYQALGMEIPGGAEIKSFHDWFDAL